MILVLLVFLLLPNVSYSQFCQQCANRRLQYASGYPQQQQQRNYNFNFEKFFSQFPGFTAPQKSSPSSFSSLPSPTNSRTFNVYGQDAEAFGSAIGKSIGQRIQQAFGTQQDPTYDIQFTPPSSPSSSSSSIASSPSEASASTAYASMSPSTSSSYPSSYGSSSYAPSSYATSPSAYPTSTSSWPSTHPPEDLPTVQQAFQAQQRSYGATPQSLMGNSNGFGGMPGMLPPPQNSDCPWCSQNGGYRGKRIPSEEEQKKEEKKEEKI